jgi:hypothetical protein
MSTSDNPNDPPASTPTNSPSNPSKPKETQLTIDVDRSPEIEALRREKEEQIRKLQEQLRAELDAKQQYESTLKKAQDELDQKTGLLSEIALRKFNDDKTTFIEAVKRDLGDDKAEQFGDMIGDDPQKLEEMKGTFQLLSDVITQKTAEPPPPVNPQNPPPGAGASIPPELAGEGSNKGPLMSKEYESYSEMVNDIYKISQDPRHPEHDNATKVLNQWWEKALPQIKEKLRSMSIAVSECPRCGMGIYGDTCWNCAWEATPFEDRG